MALGGEIVDLGRPGLLHQVGRVCHVALVRQERHFAGVRLLVEMIDARAVERGRPSLDAMLGYNGKQRNAPFRILSRHVHSNPPPGLPRDQFNAGKPWTLRWTSP